MAILPNCGVVALQPSATPEAFSAWHFLLLRVIVGLAAVGNRAGDERADVHPGGGMSRVAFPPRPGAGRMLGVVHSTFVYLVFN